MKMVIAQSCQNTDNKLIGVSGFGSQHKFGNPWVKQS